MSINESVSILCFVQLKAHLCLTLMGHNYYKTVHTIVYGCGILFVLSLFIRYMHSHGT